METPEPITRFFQSNTARMIMVGALTLILLIPLFFVQNLIQERQYRQKEVVREISGKWGESVYFYGPILKVPFQIYTQTTSVNEKTKETTTQRIPETHYAYFFPEVLQNTSAVNTTKRYRNNYESVVYESRMQFSGRYVTPDFSGKDIAAADIHWDKATVMIRTSNMGSIRDEVTLSLGGKKYAFEPMYSETKDSVATLETGFIDAKTFLDKPSVAFNFDVVYNGSQQIRMVPIGKTTQARMTSNWPDPSFSGRFLPSDSTKKITDKGFVADWKILHINRPFGQQSFGNLPDLSDFAFGVNFIVPVDQYQQNERAAKYGFLVIGLTFLVFFLIQVVSKVRIHIFQYTMIGLALVMFYTLLVSITEHSSFLTAYLIAAVSVVAMIGLYSVSILKGRKFPLFIVGALSALYGFIYVIIQLENYALLFGSIGLFAILGAVMYASRKIDWN
ncbi:cell envelope integrity protein CreD [Flavobacterium caeni]|uniref:Inner membrane protein n=1 Tax=Flavobacterium caeni TaxID=490189 RepID=A0A1G5B450_9FLAO|nr:cell envelope integrity protein CreD [Flavobacterium caeni]SCX84948.1 inner membrane protein [Flavobacterium caeni]